MAKIGDIPVELITVITDHLRRARDLAALAALARASQKFYNVVDPILYKFAKEQLSAGPPCHPLRWAAEIGQTGTLKKALAAGIDVNMRFNVNTYMPARDLESFQIRVEAVDGKGVWDPPQLEPNHEWQPQEDDTDDDDMQWSPSTIDRVRPRQSHPSRSYFPVTDDSSNFDDYEDIDGFHAGMDDFEDEDDAGFIMGHIPTNNMDWSEDEFLDDEDDDEESDVDEEEDDEDDDVERDPGDDRDPFGSFRAIHLAARSGHDDVVQFLLDHGASIDVYSRVLCRCVPIVARSAAGRHGIPIGRDEAIGFSPLHLAICHFQASTAKFLLSRGASIRLSEPHRDSASTALHAAAVTGQVDLCMYLLDRDYIDVDVLDHSGLTPFYYAYLGRRWDSTLPFLLERGADIDFSIRHLARPAPVEGGEFSTVLYEACVFGRYIDAMKLINLGADVNKGHYSHDVQQKWPLHAVCQPPRASDELFGTPAMRFSAASKNNGDNRLELIRLMLRVGADLEAKSHPDLESPLQYAAMNFDVASLPVLLAEGADVESRKYVYLSPAIPGIRSSFLTFKHSLQRSILLFSSFLL